MKNTVKLLFVLALLVLGWSLLNVNQGEASETIVVEKGENAREIAFKLKEENIISDPYSFLFLAFLENKWSKLQAGEYLLDSSMSSQEILDILQRGETIKETLTIVEGWDAKDIAEYLESKKMFSEEEVLEKINEFTPSQFEFLADKPKNLGLEGYIFPDTYFFAKSEGLENIIIETLKNFDQKLTADLREEAEKQKKSIFDTITMASMIEKEVITFEDKQIVSGILWKRLKAGVPLQVDATVLYAMEINNGKVLVKDTKIDSPYNTYKYAGLPLGPICNPGLESIKAALYPKQTDYWYYLSKPTGETVFSRTLEEHNIAKAKYLK
ncbi:MAG: endolytic transglycosylase MltG [Candidatus Pacebacteria bacterium]|nr:endolytic transglycosylase MltG [Candidatus Paceibacterota bacterium]